LKVDTGVGGRGFLLREKWDREEMGLVVCGYAVFVDGGLQQECRGRIRRDRERDVDLLAMLVEKPRLEI
jgi:hypothetical protein